MSDYWYGTVVGFCSFNLGIIVANRIVYGQWFPVLYCQRQVRDMLAEQRRWDRHQPLRDAYQALTEEVKKQRSRT